MHNDLAKLAYYGGWFELLSFGRLGKPVYEYDINSAYPAAMVDLPCLIAEHGNYWEPLSLRGRIENKNILFYDGRQPISNYQWALYKVKWNWTNLRNVSFGPLPIRLKSGRIIRPLQGRGWYWSNEVSAASTFGPLELEQAIGLIQICQCQPFQWVTAEYLQRLHWAKEYGKTAAIPYKLALNSAYGKLAQRSPIEGPWTNYTYAGMITASTRAKLLEAACHIHKNCMIYFATDAIVCDHKLPVTIDNGLGNWSEQYTHDIFTIQPGIYLRYDEHDQLSIKSRGISAKHLAPLIETVEQFTAMPEHHEFVNGKFTLTQVQFNAFIGARLAMARNRPETLGEWLNVTRAIGFDVFPKRRIGYIRSGINSSMHTLPPLGNPGLTSWSMDDCNLREIQEDRIVWDAITDTPIYDDLIDGIS